MSVRRRRFSPPTVPPNNSRSGRRGLTIEGPGLGYQPLKTPEQLQPGEYPLLENVMIRDRRLVPRPGLFQRDTSDIFSGAAVHGVVPANAQVNNDNLEFFWAFSDGTVARSDGGGGGTNWNASTGVDFGFGELDHYQNNEWVDATVIWSDQSEAYFFVFTGGDFDAAPVPTNTPQYSAITSTNVAPSHYTVQDFLDSGESNAKNVASFDDRLIFFNTLASNGTYHSNRIRWSVRGDPLDFTSIGAGFEDIRSMVGEGTAIKVDSTTNRLILFTTDELWIGTPRRDDFSFSFEPLDRSVGCIRRKTIVETPFGIVFIGNDDVVYLVANNRAVAISKRFQRFLRDEDHVSDEDGIYATYNPLNRSYLLFFQEATLTDEADKVLEIYLDTVSRDREPAASTWRFEDPKPTAAAVADQENYVWFFSSDGSFWRVADRESSDSVSEINCKIRTPVLSASRDRLRFEAPTEAWIGYRSEASSHISTFYSVDQGGSFSEIGERSLNTASNFSELHVPMNVQAARHPMLEFRFQPTNPGGIGDLPSPEIGPIHLTLRSYTGRHDG